MAAKSFAEVTVGNTGTPNIFSTDFSNELCEYVVPTMPGLACGPTTRNGIKFEASPSSHVMKMTASCDCVYAMMRGSSFLSQVSPARMFDAVPMPDGHVSAPCMSLHRFGVMNT